MTTYGKKNRGVKSSFTVFQDKTINDHKSESQPPRTVVGWNSKTDKSLSVDESVDELAENSPPLHSTQPLAPISRNGITSRTGPTRPKSNGSMQESIDKPLPPIPLQIKSDAKAQVRRPLQALRVKTTNLKVPSTNRTLLIRPKLATSSSQDSDFGARRALVEEQGNERFKNPQSTSFETEDLSKKISSLMQTATVANPKSNGKKGADKLGDEPRSSPLKRGGEVISKATRSIASGFNGGKPTITPAEIHERIAQIYDERPATRDTTSDHRHLYMKIPRKPLPVYESMRSGRDSVGTSLQPLKSSPQESNHADNQGEVTPAVVGLDFSFDNPKVRNTKSRSSPREPFSFESKASSNTAFDIARHQRRRTFSNAISGLAQHPVVDTFSSSPVDHSTPKSRLDPTHTPTQSDTKTPKEVQRSPSIIEFSFERSDTDGTSSPSVSPVAVADTSGDELGLGSGGKGTRKSSTQSVKRKNSEVDLRSHLHPDSKRPKTLFAKDDSALVKHLDSLATMDNSATVHDVLGERDPNTKMLPRPNIAKPKNSTNKGLGIFQVPKGKGPERLGGRSKTNLFPPPISVTHQSAALEPVKRASGRPLGPGSRGSRPDIGISRPTSILFSRDSRESRGVVRARREWEKVRKGNRNEEMEIDELAM